MRILRNNQEPTFSKYLESKTQFNYESQGQHYVMPITINVKLQYFVSNHKKAKLGIWLGDKVYATVTTCIYFGYVVSRAQEQIQFFMASIQRRGGKLKKKSVSKSINSAFRLWYPFDLTKSYWWRLLWTQLDTFKDKNQALENLISQTFDRYICSSRWSSMVKFLWK